MATLDFETPLLELQERIEALKGVAEHDASANEQIRKLQSKLMRLRNRIYGRLTPWQKVQLARHIHRPHCMDFIEGMLDEFVELHGDRMGHEDMAVVGGLGRMDGIPLVVIGHEKGRTIQQRAMRNFGMAHPEGNRKARRLMILAERFRRPVLSLVDTPGAFPGVEAEERGQAGAIAENLLCWAALRTPSVAVIIGEGGSGGALALAMADRVLMMENAIYSVIMPEGCAAILWRDEDKKEQAAEALCLTAKDALRFGVIDEIIEEPPMGAHRDHQGTMERVREACIRHLRELASVPVEVLLERRYDRYRRLGVWEQASSHKEQQR
jgi:acetyl-CoA carboxylase carboxyl transferase subunit alpha